MLDGVTAEVVAEDVVAGGLDFDVSDPSEAGDFECAQVEGVAAALLGVGGVAAGGGVASGEAAIVVEGVGGGIGGGGGGGGDDVDGEAIPLVFEEGDGDDGGFHEALVGIAIDEEDVFEDGEIFAGAVLDEVVLEGEGDGATEGVGVGSWGADAGVEGEDVVGVGSGSEGAGAVGGAGDIARDEAGPVTAVGQGAEDFDSVGMRVGELAGSASGGGEGSESCGGGGNGDGWTAGRVGVEGVEVGGGGGEAVVDEVGAAALVYDLGVGAVGGEGAGDGVGAGGGTDESGDFSWVPSEAGFFAAWEDDEAAADREGEGFAGGDSGGVLSFESEAVGAVDEGGLAGEDAFGREGPGGRLGVERKVAFGEGP